MLDRLTQDERLDGDPGFGHLGQIVFGDRHDAESDLWFGRDEALLGEAGQDFAEHADADVTALPAAEHTPAAAVRDLVTLIDGLGSGAVDVLGFSYGGQLVQRLVVAEPERVRRAVIASSSILPVPADAFAGWKERDERLAAEPATVGF